MEETTRYYFYSIKKDKEVVADHQVAFLLSEKSWTKEAMNINNWYYSLLSKLTSMQSELICQQ